MFRIVNLIFVLIITMQIMADIPNKGMLLWLDCQTLNEFDEGQNVIRWEDKSGKGNDAVQDNALSAPKYSSDYNSIGSAVVFDGHNSYLSVPDLKLSRDITVFIIFYDAKQLDGKSVHRPLLLADNDPYRVEGNGYGIGSFSPDNPGYGVYLSDGGFVDNIKALQEQADLQAIISVKKFNSDTFISYDGSSLNTFISTGGLNRHLKDVEDFHIGYNIGGSGSNDSRYYKGAISEVIVYDRALNDFEEGLVYNYLSSKYKIKLNNTYLPEEVSCYVTIRGLLSQQDIQDKTGNHRITSNDINIVDDVIHKKAAMKFSRGSSLVIENVDIAKNDYLFIGFFEKQRGSFVNCVKMTQLGGKPDYTVSDSIIVKFTNGSALISATEDVYITDILLTQGLMYEQVETVNDFLMVQNQIRKDSRYVKNGNFIFENVYADQAYIAKMNDDLWVCVITTSQDSENAKDRHLVITTSNDQGKTWSKATPAIEPAEDMRQPSWATLYINSFGRLYCFYNLRKENRSGIEFCYRYSDDGAQTWSDRYIMPIRETEIDRKFRGRNCSSWGIDSPIVVDDKVYIAFSKFGGPDRHGEGFFFVSDNIKFEKNANNISWKMLPEGDFGVHSDEMGSLQEEHNIVPLPCGGIYCAFRTLDGYIGETYSFDGGYNWSKPQYIKYADGAGKLKNPRACPRVFRCSNGKYLIWYHNHDGRDVAARNKDRDYVWFSGGEYENGKIRWSQPELALYGFDFAHNSGMSYPDMVEHNGSLYISETQKQTARLHEIDTKILDTIWRKVEVKEIDESLIYDLSAPTGIEKIAFPSLYNDGFTITFAVEIDKNTEKKNIVSIVDKNEAGINIKYENESLWVEVYDNKHKPLVWKTDKDGYNDGRRHFVSFVFDGKADIVSAVVNGEFVNGAEQRKYGWGKFSKYITKISDSATVQNIDSRAVSELLVHNRTLLTNEVVSIHNSKFSD